MPFKYAYIIPVFSFVWFIATFIITYCIAVYREDVTPVFPYISDTGTWSPESCFFGLMLNIGAITQGLIVYIRYRQVLLLLEKESFKPILRRLNKFGIILGCIAAFGVCLVANFQESNVLVVHVLGALGAFGCGSVYLCLQTYISFQLYPIFGSKKLNIIRAVCSAICCITFFITFIFAGLSLLQFTGDDITKWTKDDGGYVNHFISTVAEWILAIAVILYLSLYAGEFKRVSISQPLLTEVTVTGTTTRAT